MPRYSLNIITNPEKAKIVIYSKIYNDVSRKKKSRLLDGFYKVKVHKYGYVTKIFDVTLDSDKVLNCDIERKLIPVIIKTNLDTIKVEIKEINVDTDYREIEKETELPVGKYMIRLTGDKLKTKIRKFEIFEDDDVVKLSYNLYKELLNVRFNIKPEKTHLYINDKNYEFKRDFQLPTGEYNYKIVNIENQSQYLTNKLYVSNDDLIINELLIKNKYKIIYDKSFKEDDLYVISKSKNKYMINDLLSPGDYSVIINKEGYNIYREDITIVDKDYYLKVKLSDLTKDGEYNLTFNVYPEDTTVYIERVESNISFSDSGKYIFKVVPGKYKYTLRRAGYDEYIGYTTIIDNSIIINRMLNRDKYNVKFKLNPPGTSVVITQNGTTVGYGPSALLKNGNYEFEASCSGYMNITGKFIILNDDLTIPIKLKYIDKSKLKLKIYGFDLEDGSWVEDRNASVTVSGNGYIGYGYDHSIKPGIYNYEITSIYGEESGEFEMFDEDYSVEIRLNKYLFDQQITLTVYPSPHESKITATYYRPRDNGASHKTEDYSGKKVFRVTGNYGDKINLSLYIQGAGTSKMVTLTENEDIYLTLDESEVGNLSIYFPEYLDVKLNGADITSLAGPVELYENGKEDKLIEVYGWRHVRLMRNPGVYNITARGEGFYDYSYRLVMEDKFQTSGFKTIYPILDPTYKISEYDNSKLKRYLLPEYYYKFNKDNTGRSIFVNVNIFDIKTFKNITRECQVSFYLSSSKFFYGHENLHFYTLNGLDNNDDKGYRIGIYHDIRKINFKQKIDFKMFPHYTMYSILTLDFFVYDGLGLKDFLYTNYDNVEVKFYPSDKRGLNMLYKDYRPEKS